MTIAVHIDVLVTVRELPTGAVYVRPVAGPEWTVRSRSQESAVAELGRFLAKKLSDLPASRLSSFVFPSDASLVEVRVPIPKADLPNRIRVLSAVRVPCVVVPDDRDEWIHILPLFHTIRVAEGEQRERRVRNEVIRVAEIRELDDEDYPRVFPGTRHQVMQLPVTVTRKTIADLGSRAAERREARKHRDRDKAIKLLKEVAEPFVDRNRSPVVGVDEPVNALLALLSGDQRLSVALVGPSLVGKSAVISGAFTKAPPHMVDALYVTSGSRLVAGQSGFGMLEERVEQVMKAVELLDAILYFDDLSDLFAGDQGGIEDLAAMMRPYLAAQRVRIVGELTPEQWEHHQRRHVGFFSGLTRLSVEPMHREQTRAVLGVRAARLEPAAVEPLLRLSERYLPYQTFPGKAVRFYDELLSVIHGDVDARGEPGRVSVLDVYRAFSIRSGVPEFLVRDDQAFRLEWVRREFATRVIGQQQATERVAETLAVVKAQLQPADKPLATFLFVGPTGVGKTEVAKTLATILFGDEQRMIRFDMSEYMDPFAAERLIRGTERDEGELTRRVRQQPFCVVLLDEIEKADHAVFDLLLQVCGEGRLTDARGRTAYFHNAILIMTSNLGASHRQVHVGFNELNEVDAQAQMQAEERYYIDQVDRHFRPEFVNRIDRIIPFSSLSPDEIARIAEVLLHGIERRAGLTQRGASLVIEPEALRRLSQRGYSETYGARALRREMERQLVAPIARMLSALGGRAYGVRIVVMPIEASGSAHGTHPVATENVADLRILAFERNVKASRRSLYDLDLIAALRRNAYRCLTSGAIRQLDDRIDYLVADLAGSRHERGSRALEGAPSRAEGTVELAVLQKIQASLRDALASITTSEELALVADYEREDTRDYVQAADLAYSDFERAFVRAVLRDADPVTLLVRGVEHPRALRWWLQPLLAAAPKRGWNLRFHRLEDPDVEGVDGWPGKRWGPPRTMEWIEQAFARDLEKNALGKDWRALLMVVPHGAAGLIRLECGLHRRLDETDASHRTEHVEILEFIDGDQWSGTDVDKSEFEPPERTSARQASRADAIRIWDHEGLRMASSMFPKMTPESYWVDAERVAFGALATAAVASAEHEDLL